MEKWIILAYIACFYIIYFKIDRQVKRDTGIQALESETLKMQLRGLYAVILSVFLVGGGWALFYGISIKVIDFADLIFSGVAVGLCLTVIIILYFTQVLKANIVQNYLIYTISLSLVAFSLFGIVLIHYVNIKFDKNAETQIMTLVKRKYISRRYGRCNIVVDSWTSRALDERFRVSEELYRKVAIGDELTVTQKPGFLGIRWVKEWSVTVTVQGNAPLNKTLPLPSDFNNTVFPAVQSIK